MDRGVRYSRKVLGKSSGRTVWFGRNLRASALGVSSVWMKIVRRAWVAGAACRLRGCARGLCCVFRGLGRAADVETRRVVLVASLALFVMVDVLMFGRGRAFERQRIAGFEAIFSRVIDGRQV